MLALQNLLVFMDLSAVAYAFGVGHHACLEQKTLRDN